MSGLQKRYNPPVYTIAWVIFLQSRRAGSDEISAPALLAGNRPGIANRWQKSCDQQKIGSLDNMGQQEVCRVVETIY